jgi:hypothetical protein
VRGLVRLLPTWHLGAKQTAMVFHGCPTRASNVQKDPQVSGGRTAQLLPPTGADTGGGGTVRVDQCPRGCRGVEVNEESCHVACRGVANGRRSGGTISGHCLYLWLARVSCRGLPTTKRHSCRKAWM